MSKTLKTWAKCGAVTLIENHLPASLHSPRARRLPAPATPRGVVRAPFSLPVCVTPYSLLALRGVKK